MTSLDRPQFQLAVISDVHADVEALRDALVQIDRLGCDQIVCCGDLVDYGPHPEDTLRLLAERGIQSIRGNHDRWALEAEESGRTALSSAALEFLRHLPTRLDLVIQGVRVAVRHGQPHSDMEGVIPDRETPEDLRQILFEAGADVLLVGHTHLAFSVGAAGGGLVCNPGALLRDPVQRLGAITMFNSASGRFETVEMAHGGTFGVLELPDRRFTVRGAVDGTIV